MTTEFLIEWVGFTPNEKQRLRARWARLTFPAEFCARFAGRVHKGAPVESGGIWIQATALSTFTEYWSEELNLRNLDEFVTTAAEVVIGAAQRWKTIVSGGRSQDN
jgi:hypothetical protein